MWVNDVVNVDSGMSARCLEYPNITMLSFKQLTLSGRDLWHFLVETYGHNYESAWECGVCDTHTHTRTHALDHSHAHTLALTHMVAVYICTHTHTH